MIARLKSAFVCIHERAQNAGMKRHYELQASGKLRAVVLPFLGQDDSRLKYPPVDLVAREAAYAYPTDFAAMSSEWIYWLSRRGEQLTKALSRSTRPHLVAPQDQPPGVPSAGTTSAGREAAAPSVRQKKSSPREHPREPVRRHRERRMLSTANAAVSYVKRQCRP